MVLLAVLQPRILFLGVAILNMSTASFSLGSKARRDAYLQEEVHFDPRLLWRPAHGFVHPVAFALDRLHPELILLWPKTVPCHFRPACRCHWPLSRHLHANWNVHDLLARTCIKVSHKLRLHRLRARGAHSHNRTGRRWSALCATYCGFHCCRDSPCIGICVGFALPHPAY
jgi:hypothetical protein